VVDVVDAAVDGAGASEEVCRRLDVATELQLPELRRRPSHRLDELVRGFIAPRRPAA
jgi:hypothetical protein